MELEIPENLASENNRKLWIFTVLVASLTVGLVLGIFITNIANADGKSLEEQVSDGPRTGVVVSNVGDEVCLQLLREDGTADKSKSCTKIHKIFNYAQPSFGQPAIAAPLGDIYEVHRVKDFGVTDGLVFYPHSGAPIPSPTPGVDIEPEGK